MTWWLESISGNSHSFRPELFMTLCIRTCEMHWSCDKLRSSRKNGWNYINPKATSSLNYRYVFQRTEGLRLCGIENLGPASSKSKVFEIKRN